MSNREKKMLGVLLLMAFILGNYFLYESVYQKWLKKYQAQTEFASKNTELASQAPKNQNEIDWLQGNQKPSEDVYSKRISLNKYVESSLSRFGLQRVGKLTLLNDVTHVALAYHRVRVQLKVVGGEKAVYGWVNDIHNPKEFRGVTSLKVIPDGKDETKVNAIIVVEEWFKPLSPEELESQTEDLNSK